MAKFEIFYNKFKWKNDQELESVPEMAKIEVDVPEGLKGAEKYPFIRDYFLQEEKKISNKKIEVTSISEGWTTA
ncbi:MAG TPA: hypothetical protein VF648_07150 [Pyrinomonadaceae bacterium]|jgi:hypothetical protein